MKRVFIALFLILVFNPLIASDFSPIYGFRERFEKLNGMNKKVYGNNSSLVGKSDDSLLVNRLKLGFKYKQSSDIIYTVVGYYSSVYGWSLEQNDFKKLSGNQTYWMNPQEDFDFANLNIKVKNLANISGFSTKIGRQSNRYGDKRILGPGSWGNSYGWLWDLVKISYRFNGNFIDTFYGYTKDKDKYRLSLFSKHVYEGAGIYSHFKTDIKGAVEPFVVYKNGLYTKVGNGNNTEQSYTYGVRGYNEEFYNFNYDLTYAKANGTIKNKDYDAYAYVIKFGYKLKNLKFKPNLVIGQIYASGDDNPNDNTVKTFRTPFGGTDGSLYGRMDIMKWSNLVENVLELHLKPTHKIRLKLSYHDFSLADIHDEWSYYKKSNINVNHKAELGQEYDIESKWRYSKHLEFQAIYAYFNAGAFIRENVANNNAQRLFLQVQWR